MTGDNKERKVTQGSKEAKGGVTATGAVGRRVRHDITKQYFEAARYFEDCATSMENEGLGLGLYSWCFSALVSSWICSAFA